MGKKITDIERDEAANMFAYYKDLVSRMIQEGNALKARQLVRKLRTGYRAKPTYLNKKSYDGAKSGLTSKGVSRRRGKGRTVDPLAAKFKLIEKHTIKKEAYLDDSAKEPKFTVALPIFNSKKIAWVAFESLARQVDVNFSWELVIAEESGVNKIGDTLCEEYREKLIKAGCSRIVFLELEEWMPLYQKWILIYRNSSIDTSKVFMLQAADCFSQLHRLRETMDLFSKHNPDWVQSKLGYFYNVKEKTLALYNHNSLERHKSASMKTHPCCLNMAIKHNLMSLLDEFYCKKGVDRKIFSEIEKKNGKMKVVFNESNSYLTGVDTDGYNNLSTGRRNNIKGLIVPFLSPKHELGDLLSKDIIKRLDSITKED